MQYYNQMKIDFNTNILNDLIDQNPEKAVILNEQFPKMNLWLEDQDKPTFNQLGNIAHFFNIPFGYFFLRDVPEKPYPIQHFRTHSNQPFNPSQELVDTLETLQNRQQWARDLLIDILDEKLPYANRMTVNDNVEDASNEIRKILNLKDSWANDIPTWTAALQLIIQRAEQAGIFVVINGIVNNNTKRKLKVNEFRGFVLYDAYAPFIFINNNDAISGKIFTLIHEIAHILIGKSASFDLRRLQPATDEIEVFCDKVAAEFLVPHMELNNQFERIGLNYEELARTFKVSQIVIARRLKDLAYLTSEDFYNFYEEYINKERTVKTSSGGNFYNTIPYRISKQFFNLIYNSVKQNKMLYMDAFKLTGLKPKTFDEYVRKYIE